MTQIKKICLDMDGVLVDFVGRALELHGASIDQLAAGVWHIEKSLGITPEDFWGKIKGHDFWVNLEPTPEMADIVRMLDPWLDKVWLTTSPSQDPGSWSGKWCWVEKHLPMLTRRLMCCQGKVEWFGPDCLVIDDRDRNCDDAEQVGAKSILVPRIWNRLYPMRSQVVPVIAQRLAEVCHLLA